MADTTIIIKLLVTFLSSFVLALILTPLARWASRKLGIMDYPGPRKIHAKPTPLLGGTAIYIAFFAATLFALGLDRQLVAILVSSFLILAVSILDDKWRVSAFVRFIVHIVAVIILLTQGITIELITIPYISIPIAVLWVVGVCNSFNAMDSTDGLLGGLAIIYSIVLAVISFVYGEYFNTICFAAIAGAALGFLRYNFSRASIFLGDNGSTFLGFVIAALILRGIGPTNIVVPVLVIGLPIYDIILVHLRRYLAGNTNLIELLGSTGKDHLAHRLMSSGLSRRKTVLVIYFYTIVTAVIASLFIKPNVIQQVITLIILGIMIFYAETLTVAPKETISIIHHSKPDIWEDDVEAVSSTLRSGFLSQGEKVLDFEDKMRHFVGRKYALAVNSGTSALHLALLSLGIKEGDEVILPTYLCSAVLNPITYLRATPVLIDTEKSNFNVSVDCIRQAATPRTKAIIVPHLFGCPVPIDEIISLGVPIIEDCAQAIGGTYKGKELGSYGDVSICSFYATKMMTTGQGGMVLTDDEDIYQRALDLREFDGCDNYKARYNYKLTDIQAALGIVQLERLPEFTRYRRSVARRYNSVFSKLPFTLPEAARIKENVFFRYVMLTDEFRDDVIGQYRHLGIEVKKPVHKPLHRYLKLDPDRFPQAEKLMEKAISIPIYPALDDHEIERIIDATRQIFTTS